MSSFVRKLSLWLAPTVALGISLGSAAIAQAYPPQHHASQVHSSGHVQANHHISSGSHVHVEHHGTVHSSVRSSHVRVFYRTHPNLPWTVHSRVGAADAESAAEYLRRMGFDVFTTP